MNCIIIDDEPNAIEVLKIHTRQIASLEVLSTFTNPVKALEFLQQNRSDLIFLDINMPGISGLNFIEHLKTQTPVIFTTAYSEYALESYDYNAIDYLLKPIEFHRFFISVQKAQKRLDLINKASDTSPDINTGFIYLKDGYAKIKVTIDEILYIKSEGNYLQVVCVDKKVTTRLTFAQLFEECSAGNLIRVHNCFAVNANKIERIADNRIFVHNTPVPLGSKYKPEFENYIESYSIN